MKQRILNEGASLALAVGGFDAMLGGMARDAQLVSVSPTGDMKQVGAGSRMHVPVTVDGVTLQIQSVTGRPFPAGSRATVVLEPVGLSERILLDGLDISGLSVCDAISLRLIDGDARVEVLSSSDTPVPAPTREAQLAAAAALGVKGNRLRAAHTVDLALGIDGSASMQTWLNTGALTFAAQLLAGIDLVIGRDDELDFRVISPGSVWRRAQAIRLGKELDHAFADVGSHTQVELWSSAPSGGSSWIVVTDHVPAHVPEAVTLVVVVCRSGASRVLSSLPTDQRVTCLELAVHGDTTQVDETVLRQFVSAVIAACDVRPLEGIQQ